MLRPAVATFLILVLAGCAHRADPKYYLLSPAPAPAAAAQEGILVRPVTAVIRVRLPDYLQRPQLVARNGANALSIDDDSRWGEPLAESVPRVLAENLTRYLPNARVVVPQETRGQKVPYEYVVSLDAYEPDGAGNAVMRGRWHLRDARTGTVVSEGNIDDRRRMASSTAPDAVAALNADLDEASRQIAQATAAQVGR